MLYHFLYGRMAKALGLRWLMKTRADYSDKYAYDKAKRMLFQGIKEGDSVHREFDENGNMI